MPEGTPTISATQRLRPAPHAHARDFDGELVILDLAGGKYYGLDELGGRLWSGLLEGRSPAEVAEAVAPEYDVDRETLLADLLALARELVDAGLLVPG